MSNALNKVRSVSKSVFHFMKDKKFEECFSMPGISPNFYWKYFRQMDLLLRKYWSMKNYETSNRSKYGMKFLCIGAIKKLETIAWLRLKPFIIFLFSIGREPSNAANVLDQFRKLHISLSPEETYEGIFDDLLLLYAHDFHRVFSRIWFHDLCGKIVIIWESTRR